MSKKFRGHNSRIKRKRRKKKRVNAQKQERENSVRMSQNAATDSSPPSNPIIDCSAHASARQEMLDEDTSPVSTLAGDDAGAIRFTNPFVSSPPSTPSTQQQATSGEEGSNSTSLIQNHHYRHHSLQAGGRSTTSSNTTPSSSITSSAGNAATTEVFDPSFTFLYTVPTAKIVHLPPAKLSITRLVICKNFIPACVPGGGAESCCVGDLCKFVHVDIPLDLLPKRSVHVRYAWRREDLCTYPRHSVGLGFLDVGSPQLAASYMESMEKGRAGGQKLCESLELGTSGQVEIAVRSVRADLLLVTAGSTRALSAKNSATSSEVDRLADTRSGQVVEVPVCHCPQYFYNRMCKNGEQCMFIHVVTVDPTVQGDFKWVSISKLPNFSPSSDTSARRSSSSTSSFNSSLSASLHQQHHHRHYHHHHHHHHHRGHNHYHHHYGHSAFPQHPLHAGMGGPHHVLQTPVSTIQFAPGYQHQDDAPQGHQFPHHQLQQLPYLIQPSMAVNYSAGIDHHQVFQLASPAVSQQPPLMFSQPQPQTLFLQPSGGAAMYSQVMPQQQQLAAFQAQQPQSRSGYVLGHVTDAQWAAPNVQIHPSLPCVYIIQPPSSAAAFGSF